MGNELELPRLISVSDFAISFRKSICGGIGINKIYEMCKQEGFPSIRIGDRYYVMIDKVTEWMEKESYKKKESFKKRKGYNKDIKANKPIHYYNCIDCGIKCERTNSKQKRCKICQEDYARKLKKVRQVMYRLEIKQENETKNVDIVC